MKKRQVTAQLDTRETIDVFFDAFNSRDYGTIAGIIADNYEQYSPGVPSSRNAFFSYLATICTAFPEGRYMIDDVVREGNKAAIRWTFTGKKNIAADANELRKCVDVSVSGIDIWEFNERCQISKVWFASNESAVEALNTGDR